MTLRAAFKARICSFVKRIENGLLHLSRAAPRGSGPPKGASLSMSKQEEASLILKLYELRREETMRKARDWYFREFNPQSMADFNTAMFGEHSGHLRMVRHTRQ